SNSPNVLALRSEASKSRCAPFGRPFDATRFVHTSSACGLPIGVPSDNGRWRKGRSSTAALEAAPLRAAGEGESVLADSREGG
ncbi:MAG TPA: hypothetical protein VGJ57_10695, partial [Nitrospirales bacterium]